VDIVTLTIGEVLTVLVDKLIVDVLCWMPENYNGNAGGPPLGQDEEVETYVEDDLQHMHASQHVSPFR
jgi:hypothetical protein